MKAKLLVVLGLLVVAVLGGIAAIVATLREVMKSY